jgi:hypothetical protein
MKTSDFDYDLPGHMIAQTPAEPRDSSRLLVLHRDSGEVEHRIFSDLPQYLRKDDLLVLNQTRVIPARVFARKKTGGRIELLLLRKRNLLTWEALVSGKGTSPGRQVTVEVARRPRSLPTSKARRGLCVSPNPSSRSWTGWETYRCHPTFMRTWMIPSDTKPYMPRMRAQPPPLPPACTSHLRCSTG